MRAAWLARHETRKDHAMERVSLVAYRRRDERKEGERRDIPRYIRGIEDRTRIVVGKTHLTAIIGARARKCHVVYRDDSLSDARNIGILRSNWFLGRFSEAPQDHAEWIDQRGL